MSSWSDIVKYLNLNKGRKATQAEAAAAEPPFDKYYKLRFGRKIVKVPISIVLQAHTEVTNNQYIGRFTFQYNVDFSAIAPLGFYITRIPAGPKNLLLQEDSAWLYEGHLQVKFREGNTVTRYYIAGQRDIPANVRRMYSESYGGQLIKPQCVFEFWHTIDTDPYVGLLQDIVIQSDLLIDPTGPDDIGHTYPFTATPYSSMAIAMPAAMPMITPTIAWNSN